MISLFDGGSINRVNLEKVRPRRGEQKFCCNFCDDERSWESETEVYIHKMKTHASKVKKRSPNEPICRVCLRVCCNRKELHKHMKSVHLLSSEFALRVEREIYVCDECDQIFFNKHLLAIHIAQRHKLASTTDVYQCPKCPKQLSLKQVWVHFNVFHEAQSLWRCPVCMTKCDSPEGLSSHMRTHPKHLSCEICIRKFHNPRSFLEHSLKHAADANKARDVTSELNDTLMCNKYFVPNVKRVVRASSISIFNGLTIPPGMKICVLCREICGKRRMRAHLNTHLSHKVTEQSKSSIRCHCGAQFDSKILYKQHLFKMKCNYVEVPLVPETEMEEQIEIVVVTEGDLMNENDIENLD